MLSLPTARVSFMAACVMLLVKATNGFVPMPPCFGAARTQSGFAAPSPLYSASMGETQGGEAAGKVLARMQKDELWLEQLQSQEVQQVRKEMVNKYISLGKPTEVAEQEVDAFLNDREKALPFIEMRRYAKRKMDDMGLEVVLQSTAVFFVCLFATVGIQYYTAYMATYPDGNGPIPFW